MHKNDPMNLGSIPGQGILCCTRIYSSRMCTARSLPYGALPNRDPPGQRPPWMETPS